jgi:tRNA pseudouridine38-40 synthase
MKKAFKLKVAILFGYNGTKFHGLQKVAASHLPTVEGALEKALFDVGLIPEHNFGTLQKSGWGRGSRTDKGVHASVNTVKCKIVVSDRFTAKNEADAETTTEEQAQVDKKAFKKMIDYQRMVTEINAIIDPEIQVFGIKLVTKNFDVKNSARSRKYEYILPAKLLSCKSTEGLSKDDLLEKVNTTIGKFKGCRNYHNFTKKGDPNSKSMDRFILDIKAEYFKPEYLEPAPKEDYIIIYLHGQSFLYHQIRKMIGSLLQLLQLDLGDAFLDTTFQKTPSKIWLAPSQGLLLDRVSLIDLL